MTADLSELRAEIAACHVTLDKIHESIRQLKLIALRDEAVKRGESVNE